MMKYYRRGQRKIKKEKARVGEEKIIEDKRGREVRVIKITNKT